MCTNCCWRPSRTLREDQAAAALAVLTDGRRVSVINAPAGSGKTWVLAAAGRAWVAAGLGRVIGITPSSPPRGPELPSRQVEDDLRRRCAAGEWKPGERLPAVADLATHYGVARNTVTKALRRLAEDGLVEIVPSWGTFRARR